MELALIAGGDSYWRGVAGSAQIERDKGGMHDEWKDCSSYHISRAGGRSRTGRVRRITIIVRAITDAHVSTDDAHAHTDTCRYPADHYGAQRNLRAGPAAAGGRIEQSDRDS